MDSSDSEDEEFHLQQKHADLPAVELGFGEPIEPAERFRLNNYYFPLGKIGGQPEWLCWSPLPSAEQLQCKVCGKPMCVVVQLYAPVPDVSTAFHRVLYVFVCRAPACSQTDSAQNMAVLRSQLPRINDFYAPEAVPDPDDEPDFRPERTIADVSKLCAFCGCAGDKRCGRCEQVTYCSREHQALHWKYSHKNKCGQASSAAADGPESNPWLFPEYELVTETEVIETDGGKEKSKKKSDEARMSDYREFLKQRVEQKVAQAKAGQQNANEPDLIENAAELDDCAEEKVDKTFERFHKILSQNPEQVLRYQRGGRALWAAGEGPDGSASVPPCARCGADRLFELQLMPHLLALMKVDSVEASIDWATVAVYTCANSCPPAADSPYLDEVALKQDFE